MAASNDKSIAIEKAWSLFRMPFCHSSNSSSSQNFHRRNQLAHQSDIHSPITFSSVTKSLLPTGRSLILDPPTKLYFPYEPGKQVRSAIRIKNVSKSCVAFKEVYLLPAGESLIATVFKFVEHPENNEKLVAQKSRAKFKIMSLKLKGEMDYIPELRMNLDSLMSRRIKQRLSKYCASSSLMQNDLVLHLKNLIDNWLRPMLHLRHAKGLQKTQVRELLQQDSWSMNGKKGGKDILLGSRLMVLIQCEVLLIHTNSCQKLSREGVELCSVEMKGYLFSED